MATRTISNAGGNYNSTASWVEGVVPTAADDVVATATSGNLVVNVTSACRSMDLTSYVGAVSGAAGLNIGTTTPGPGNVALKLAAGNGWTRTGTTTFVSTSATVQTITSAGINFTAGITFNGTGGRWKLLDALSMTGKTLSMTDGTFDSNNFSVAAGRMTGSGVATRTLLMGTSIWTLSGGASPQWNPLADTILSAASSTIVLPDADGSGRTFAGQGGTYGTVSLATGGAGLWTVTGSNTFATLTAPGGSAKTVRFTAGTTQTLTGGANCFFSGIASNLITCNSVTDGSAWNLNKSSGTVDSSYLSLQDSAAAGGAVFTALNSTNVSGNSGWIFGGPPLGSLGLLGVGR